MNDIPVKTDRNLYHSEHLLYHEYQYFNHLKKEIVQITIYFPPISSQHQRALPRTSLYRLPYI